MDWKSLINILAPVIISSINPKMAALAPIVSAGIQEAEELPGADGPTKLAHVTNLVNIASTGINTTAGRTIVDVPALGTTVQSIVSAIVDGANAIHPHAQTVASGS